MEEVKNWNYLEQMYEAQKVLLAEYITIEGLPQYPIDINTKSGQKLVRDFISRYTEELFEAYQELGLALIAFDSNEPGEARKHILKYQEEIADSNHFLLEILIYAGIDTDLIEVSFRAYGAEQSIGNLMITNNPLSTLFNVGNFANAINKEDVQIGRASQYVGFTRQYLLENGACEGGNRLSKLTLEKHALFMFKILSNLSYATMMLKNKAWVLEEKKVNEIQFIETMMGTLLVMGQYWDFAGFSARTLFQGYMEKNAINKQRIKDKY